METYFRSRDDVKTFAKKVSEDCSISYISVLDMLELTYKDVMRKLSESFSGNNLELIERSASDTLDRCSKWLESNFVEEITASHLVSYSLPYLFFNILRKGEKNG